VTRPLRIAAIILAVIVLAVAVALLVGWHTAVGVVGGAVVVAGATRTVRREHDEVGRLLVRADVLIASLRSPGLVPRVRVDLEQWIVDSRAAINDALERER